MKPFVINRHGRIEFPMQQARRCGMVDGQTASQRVVIEDPVVIGREGLVVISHDRSLPEGTSQESDPEALTCASMMLIIGWVHVNFAGRQDHLRGRAWSGGARLSAGAVAGGFPCAAGLKATDINRWGESPDPPGSR